MPLIKNLADFLEKLAVGSLCVGLFQENDGAVILGTVTCIFWMILRIVEFLESLPPPRGR